MRISMLSSRRLMYKFVMVIALSLYVISISQPWLIQYIGGVWSGYGRVNRFWSFQVVTENIKAGKLDSSTVLRFHDFWFLSEFSQRYNQQYYMWFPVLILQILGVVAGALSIVMERVKNKPLPLVFAIIFPFLSLILWIDQYQVLDQSSFLNSGVDFGGTFLLALTSVILWTFPIWNDVIKHEVGTRKIAFRILSIIESGFPTVVIILFLLSITEFYFRMGGGTLWINWNVPAIGVESRGAGIAIDIRFLPLGLTCIPLFFDSTRTLYKVWKNRKKQETTKHE